MADTKEKALMDTTDSVEGTVMPVPIGRNTYLVGIHFNNDSTETLEEKLSYLIRREIQEDACG